MNHFWANFAY